tara:strand:- start:392 stop:1774 length:1383 start_codon:yes stop_codon:yes gene_type:complete
MFKQNKYTKNFYIILFILSLGLIFSFLPVSMDYGGDEKNYIKNLINFYNGEFFFNENSHLSYRWGMYLVPSFFYFFYESNPLTFFLSSYVVIFIAFFFFLKIYYINNFNWISFTSFTILWFTNPEIIKLIYNILPQGTGLLVLSILTLVTFTCLKKKTDDIKIYQIFLLSILIFFLYGIKEVNVLIILPILIFLVLKFNKKQIIYFVLFGILFFFLECVLFYFLTDGKFISRIHYFFLNESSVFNTFWYEDEKFIEADGGIISRWLKISTFSKFLIPSTILITIYNIVNKKSVSLEIYITSYIILTYTLLVTFLFIKINPLVPFVPSRIDNIIIILPFCFAILIDFFFRIKFFNNKLFLFSIILIFLLPRNANFFYKNFIPSLFSTDHNILNVYKHFKKLDYYNNEKGCIIFSDLYTERLFIYFSKHKIKEIENGKVLYSLKNKECNNQYLSLKKLNIQN